MINGKRYILSWYVDDNNIQHSYPTVVIDILEQFNNNFGDLGVARGKKHPFIGINVTIHDDNNIEIHTKDQLLEAIDMFQYKTTSVVSSVAILY